MRCSACSCRLRLLTRLAQTISVVTNAASGSGTCFHFDQILPAQVSQAELFQQSAQEVVENVLSGYNGTIMAYGQTGAGKTFTMSGSKRNFEDRGVCARAISGIFQHVQQDAEHSYAVRVSYIEVYNENLFDLLDLKDVGLNHGSHGHSSNNNNSKDNASSELVIQENERGQTFIRGLKRPLVTTEEAAFDLLFQGETNRTIAEHSLNAASTRSHCIFTIYLEKKSLLDGDEVNNNAPALVYSKLNIVDLAGSERMKKTSVTGTMLKETTHINKSLTFLEQVVIALGDKKRQHIPYRQTTLTNLLKDSLGGNCRTLLIACIWPDASHNDQTLATLKFATRMMRVKTSAIINVAERMGAGGSLQGGVPSAVVEKYVQEIRQLKQELSMHDTLAGRSGVEYDAKVLASPAQRIANRESVQRFLQDSSASLPIVNVQQIQQLFLTFREMCLEQQQTVTQPPAPSASKMVTQFRALRASTPPSRGAVRLPMLKSPCPEDESNNQSRASSSPAPTTLPPLGAPPACPTSQNQAAAMSDKELFALFQAQRTDSVLDTEQAKLNLRVAKSQLTTCGLDVNTHKGYVEIDCFALGTRRPVVMLTFVVAWFLCGRALSLQRDRPAECAAPRVTRRKPRRPVPRRWWTWWRSGL